VWTHEILGFLVLYDVTIVLIHVQIHICTEKRAINARPETFKAHAERSKHVSHMLIISTVGYSNK
jgi:hypothetical protein